LFDLTGARTAMIYNTRCEQANLYTTDAVIHIYNPNIKTLGWFGEMGSYTHCDDLPSFVSLFALILVVIIFKGGRLVVLDEPNTQHNRHLLMK
jgi:hypothetical protein